MNKTAIKNYAIWARVQLIEAAKQRAFEYAITDGENNPNLEIINGRILSSEEKNQRSELISLIKQKGFEQVMEEAAYTWFNRFIALRFMEVNSYLPTKVRVFTDENNEFKPQILKEAMTVDLEGIDREKVLGLIEKQDNEELFKYLIIAQCNALSEGLPYVFEKVSNWTELLFPSNLLKNESVIGRLISDIDVNDWDDEVEIIGWMYQYYISEKHEEVIDPLHGKTIKKEDIPAATQLFTTDWVVRYILDNSLGRYWIERHPESKLADKLTYFVVPKSGKIPTVDETIYPEELKVLDPCVGSGHFLSYAFDILVEIYRECGWSDRDAAKSILENNLYGLDIDDRAAQLACFAVMMKARKFNRRIISDDTHLHIMAMQDSTGISDELINYISNHNQSIKNNLNELRLIFNNAKEYGSIIVVPEIDFEALYTRINQINNKETIDVTEIPLVTTINEQVLPLVHQAEILTKKYDVVATNPPYMNKYSARLKAYISEHYEAYKGDLFSVFMYRNFDFCKINGYSGFMTPNTWLAAKQFDILRNYIFTNKSISDFVQMAKGAFFREATVDICAFVFLNHRTQYPGRYIRLEQFKGDMEIQGEKTREAIETKECHYRYECGCDAFCNIPGIPLAYWISPKGLEAFNNDLIKTIAETKQGFKTGNNDFFLRLWHEISIDKMFMGQYKYDKKWFPCNKGGDYRKWYGNRDYTVNWEHNGQEIVNYRDESGKQLSRPQNIAYNFKKALTWSTLSSGPISFRYSDESMMFESKGSECFVNEYATIWSVQGYLNSKVCMYYLSALAPTVDYSEGAILKLPWINVNNKSVDSIVGENINLSRQDWDSFETSWDFKKHPLV